MQWVGRIGWIFGLLAGAFGALLGTAGYFSGIGNSSPFEIVLAVVFFASGSALAGVSIWQLLVGDRRKRRDYAPPPHWGTGPRYPVSPPPPPVQRPITPAEPYPYIPPTPNIPPSAPNNRPSSPHTPPPAPIAHTVAQTPEWMTGTRSVHHWLPSGIPYTSAPTSVLGSPADLDRDSAATIPVRVREAVREIIAIEGPIERGQLVTRVAQRFGVHKPTDKQQICVLGQVPESLVRATPLGVFVWPSDLDPGTWRGFRFTPPTATRAIDTICPEEIVNAISQVAQRNRHTFDEMMWATLTQFGHERTGAAEDRVEACLTSAVRRGRLATDPDGRYRAMN
ncbi:DUF3320 domain-containing protein [Nocardia halotolerans]|uniref:DUF3320 domain-containing protein n=1 Tax=Nocardia halotolerans TaxID=1755878 RepID=A0ABV8VGT3_9NOCA